jgi:hypothetical protein
MAANVAVAQDPAGNLKPAKDKSTERIDGIVALMMAIGRAIVTREEVRDTADIQALDEATYRSSARSAPPGTTPWSRTGAPIRSDACAGMDAAFVSSGGGGGRRPGRGGPWS